MYPSRNFDMTVNKDYSKINDQFDERLEYMISRHNKVTCCRFDVRYPQDYLHDGTNNDLSNLLKLVKEPLTRDGIEMHYVWCRERNTSDNPHYHVAVLLNGNLVQRVDGIFQHTARIWSQIIGSPKEGLIDHCSTFMGEKVPKQIRINRPSSMKGGEALMIQQQQFKAQKEEARKRAHYLGKDDQKGDVPKRVREYGASELPMGW
jgi:hypothetical protein